jgi:hypothetical protein
MKTLTSSEQQLVRGGDLDDPLDGLVSPVVQLIEQAVESFLISLLEQVLS